MSSVQHLREFIRERLTAAAEEIFTEVEKTIVRYEEQLDGQRRMTGINWKPQIRLSRIDLQKPHVSVEKEASSIRQVCNQGRRAGHNQVEPDLPLINEQKEPETQWIKEEEVEPEQGKPEHPPTEEENEEPESLWAKEEQQKPDTPMIKEEEEDPEPPRTVEVKEELGLSLLKYEHLEPEHLPARQDQKDVCSRQEEEQLFQKQFVALRETSMLQEGDLGEREQLSFHPSPVVGSKDQGRSSSTASKKQSRTDTKMSVKCDICGKSLKNKYTLKVHYKIHSHTNRKKVSSDKCDICGKCFKKKFNLKQHYRTHTGEKPFCCETCGRRFSQFSHLKVHWKIHTGERPFSCETCGKSFTENWKLNFHMKQKHKSEK
ncbi:uncharacterized protein FYW61_011508 [Anableps anableps]